jgi:hypothetical protein
MAGNLPVRAAEMVRLVADPVVAAVCQTQSSAIRLTGREGQLGSGCSAMQPCSSDAAAAKSTSETDFIIVPAATQTAAILLAAAC